jgi:AP-3 complex subunit sigma
MIKSIIIFNNHGKPRLVKFYQEVLDESVQQSVVRRIFQQIVQRPDTFCNYLEGCIPEWGDATRIIYRHYATLYFVFCVDKQESELGILDLIQVFVEALDKCFDNVCELDMVFHADRVHYIIDEIIMAGMVLETNIKSIITAVNDQEKLHHASISSVASGSGTGGVFLSSSTGGGGGGGGAVSAASSAAASTLGAAQSIFSAISNSLTAKR